MGVGIKIMFNKGRTMVKGRKKTAKETIEDLATSQIERRTIFKRLLEHVRAGYSLDCFGPISEITIKRCLELYKDDFVLEELDSAMRDAKQHWEQIGYRQSTGDCLGNSRSWYYNMSNRYDWSDRQKVDQEHSGQVSVNIVNYSRKGEGVADAKA